VQPLRIALVQFAPRLGVLEENLARHRELLAEARAAGAGLVVFPELGLTGYQLQDLAAEVAMRKDDPRLLGLAAGTDGFLQSFRSSRRRTITGCSSRPRCWRTARFGSSTASCSCRPTASSTSAASSRRAIGSGPSTRAWA